MARRTSGALGAADSTASAFAFCTTVGAADADGPDDTDGAAVGAEATLFAGVSVLADDAVAEDGSGEAVGETCAVGSDLLGAIRCKFRINFITEKPITNTRMPKMSGIAETRSRPEPRKLSRAGALTGLGGGLSWRYE